jgi:NOL1/NOP2/sun family putative RNA methylase
MNLPKLFEDRMRKLLGEEFEEYLTCYDKPHFGGLRVNTLKTSPEEFERICPFSIKRIPWVRNGYYYDTQEQPAKHPLYYAGVYYIQEPSAMTPASLLPIERGDKVLDICAAPGGKSTELGAKLAGEGVLVSNDISNSRAKALLKNIELFGIRNAVVLSEAPNKLAEYFPEYFDKILIDAPCSGEGMFRKSPAIMKNWEQYGVDYYNKLQKEIILFAAKMLKPGGMMLYSTCTFSPEENEGTISFLLQEHPEFEVLSPFPEEKQQWAEKISYEGFDCGKPEWLTQLPEHQSLDNERLEELKHCVRLWPHKIDGEGHFLTLLHKRDLSAHQESIPSSAYIKEYDTKGRSVGTGKGKTEISEEAMDFLRSLKFPVKPELLHVHEDRLYLLPEGLPGLKGLRILRQGLLLGEMKKQRFEPSQALACALTLKDYDQILRLKADDPNVIRYLKCEAIEPEGINKDGWYLVCVEDYPLGWLKAAKNNYKNKYLPGWRWV